MSQSLKAAGGREVSGNTAQVEQEASQRRRFIVTDEALTAWCDALFDTKALLQGLAVQRQQMLATIVLMGINRIVVTDGKISAR